MRLIIALSAIGIVSASQCTETESKLWLEDYSFTMNMLTCAIKGSGSSGPTTSCLVSKYNGKLSESCAKCFGETVGCGSKFCGAVCAKGAYSNDCLSCTSSNGCDAGLNTCTGFEGPLKPTPPPSRSDVSPVPQSDGITTPELATTTTKSSSTFSCAWLLIPVLAGLHVM